MTTLATETWTGTTGAAWPSQWTTTAGGTSSSATIQSNAGRLTYPTVSNYAQGTFEFLSGMTASRDFDITVTVTFPVITERYLYIMGRANSTGSVGYGVNIYPAAGTASIGIVRWDSGGATDLAANLAGGTWTANVARKVRVQGIGNTIQCKVWDASGSEPSSWLSSVTDTTYSATTGRVALTVYTGASTSGSFVTLDDLTVTDGVSSTDTTAPTVPGSPAATANSATSVTVTWTASTDAVGVASYRIQRGGTTLTAGAAVVGTSFTDTTAAPSTTYSYTVSAVDAAGNRSAESSAATATTPADTTAPTVPTSVAATPNSATSVTITWAASTDAVGVASYRVLRGGSAVTGGSAVAGTSFTDTSVSGGNTYSYTVSAVDAAGNRSAESTAAGATTPAGPDVTAPSVPSGVSAVQNGYNVDISWTASTDNIAVSSYRVQRGGTTIAATITGGVTTWRDSTVAYGTTYSYTVSAVDAAGNRSAESTAAGITTAATPAKLQWWNTALGNRTTTPVTYLNIGDSVTEGTGATTKTARWQDLLLNDLRSAYPTTGVTGGMGYLPSWYAAAHDLTDSTSWLHYQQTRTGTHDDEPTLYGVGSAANDVSLGQRVDLMSAGATSVYTVTGSTVDLHWTKGYGSFTYAIDGGSATTVNTAGTTDQPGRTAGISLGTAGSHTVTITATTAVRFQGIFVYNGDETKGIRSYDCAHSGWFSYSYLNFKNLWTLVNPDLVNIELGANDFLNNAATSAQVKSYILQIIADIKAISSKTVSFVIHILNNSLTNSGNSESWAAYQSAMASIGTADSSVSVLYWTWSTTASDSVHPNNAGYAQIEQEIYPLLSASSAASRAAVGSTVLSSAYVGSTAVSKMYIGTVQIFP